MPAPPLNGSRTRLKHEAPSRNHQAGPETPPHRWPSAPVRGQPAGGSRWTPPRPTPQGLPTRGPLRTPPGRPPRTCRDLPDRRVQWTQPRPALLRLLPRVPPVLKETRDAGGASPQENRPNQNQRTPSAQQAPARGGREAEPPPLPAGGRRRKPNHGQRRGNKEAKEASANNTNPCTKTSHSHVLFMSCFLTCYEIAKLIASVACDGPTCTHSHFVPLRGHRPKRGPAEPDPGLSVGPARHLLRDTSPLRVPSEPDPGTSPWAGPGSFSG